MCKTNKKQQLKFSNTYKKQFIRKCNLSKPVVNTEHEFSDINNMRLLKNPNIGTVMSIRRTSRIYKHKIDNKLMKKY